MKKNDFKNDYELYEYLDEIGKEKSKSYKSPGDTIFQKIDRDSICESANNFFKNNLFGKSGKKVLEYLMYERGYSEEDIKKMELGAYTSGDDLFENCIGEGYPEEDVYGVLSEEMIKANIGRNEITHPLTFPYRDENNKIIAFVTRTIKDGKAKYLLPKGFKKKILFNSASIIKNTDYLILVEGYLDALCSTARELQNVVAIQNAELSNSLLDYALKCGIKKFYICFDNDKAGREGTFKTIRKIQNRRGLDVFTIEVPSKYKDIDEWIRGGGEDEIDEALKNAKPQESEEEYNRKWVRVSHHFLKQELFCTALSDEISKDVKDEAKRLGIKNTGFDLTFLQNKAIFVIQRLLTEIYYKVEYVSIEDFSEAKKFIGLNEEKLAVLEFKSTDYFDLFGVTKKKTKRGYMEYSNNQKKKALEALKELSEKLFLIDYESKIYGSIEKKSSIAPLILSIEESKKGFTDDKRVKVYRVVLHPVLTDNTGNYFMLINKDFYSEIKGLGKKSKYFARFLRYLIFINRAANTDKKEFKIKMKGLARKLQMENYIKNRNWASLKNEIIKYFELAEKLGYLVDFDLYKNKDNEDVITYTINKNKYYIKEAGGKKEKSSKQSNKNDNELLVNDNTTQYTYKLSDEDFLSL